METTQKATVAGLLFASVFWNGIVGVFVGIGLFADAFPWFVWMFLSPFILIGLGLAAALVKQILVALRVPDTVIELNHEPACPDETVRIVLAQAGNLRLKSIGITVYCHEKISYTRGTDTYREDRKLWSHSVFRASDIDVRDGRTLRETLEFTIPKDAMHSFHAEHNEIEWKLVVKGILQGWPDFEFTYPFRVLPVGAREQISWKRESLSS